MIKDMFRKLSESAYELLDHFITVNDEDLFLDDFIIDCRSRIEKAVILLNGYIRYLQTQKQCEHS